MMDVMNFNVRLVDKVICHQNFVSVVKAIIEALLAIMKYVNMSIDNI